MAHGVGSEIQIRQPERRRRPVVALELAFQHVATVGSQDELKKRADEAATGFDQGDQRA
jgi:hypothetical protein